MIRGNSFDANAASEVIPSMSVCSTAAKRIAVATPRCVALPLLRYTT